MNATTESNELKRQRDNLLEACKLLEGLSSEAMTMFQQHRAMMWQHMAKRLGSPVLTAQRAITEVEASRG